jgi:hypothetical protein
LLHAAAVADLLKFGPFGVGPTRLGVLKAHSFATYWDPPIWHDS